MGNAQPVRFGWFTGVFTPTLLTIVGVIMYVRIGWVVGNVGLAGAWLVMGIAMLITLCTGLSLSSIATNTRIGAGGPYAIVSRSLGVEVGGSIGIPLFLTRPLGVAMYVFGFREGWQWVFPEHHPVLIDAGVFIAIFGIAYWSANLAFRIQFVIMGVIVVSLVAMFLGEPTFSPATEHVQWVGELKGFPEQGLQGATFWEVFAVFFPATTGILAGANMSGDLKDPRRAIPLGTLLAIALSSLIYFVVAWWASRAGTLDELVSDYTLLISRSAFGPAVLAGLLGATFSSALAGVVGGPRILMAMGQERIVPGSSWLAATSADGEPRNAMLVTGVLTICCLMVRDLNAIAPLVTMFFLITYGVINAVVLIEGSLGLVSFRPTLRIPWIVPAVGLVGCGVTMFIVSPVFGLVSVSLVLVVYAWIQTMGVEGDGEDVRSSMFVAIAEWAAAQATEMHSQNVRAWKPSLLVPVQDPDQIRGEYHFVLDMIKPEGSVKLLGLATERDSDIEERVSNLGLSFRAADAFCTWSVVHSPDYCTGVSAGLQALQSAFFRPNLLFLSLSDDSAGDGEVATLIAAARSTGVGAFLVGRHPKAGLGHRKRVTLWVQASPGSWDAGSAFGPGRNLNLTLLMGFRLMNKWQAELHVVTCVPDEEAKAGAERFLRELCDLARIPSSARRHVMVGGFVNCIERAPTADLNILGLQPDPDFDFVRDMVTRSRSTCLFVADSGRESALA
jgi:solute carrier family 12 (sodium/potassium/chloride transporter), member 2